MENNTIEKIVSLIEANLAPEGRGKATAVSFKDFLQSVEITEEQFAVGMYWLAESVPGKTDPEKVASRRKTCGEIYALLWIDAEEHIHSVGAMTYESWKRWAGILETRVSETQDDRLSAMWATACRERDELFELVFTSDEADEADEADSVRVPKIVTGEQGIGLVHSAFERLSTQ